MKGYRLYCFDRYHRLETWLASPCASDADALTVAAGLLGDYFIVEVVEGARIVGRMAATEQSYRSGPRYQQPMRVQADQAG